MSRKKTQDELDQALPEVENEHDIQLPEDGVIDPTTWAGRDPKGFTSRTKTMSIPLFLKDSPSMINDILEHNSALRSMFGWSESEAFFYVQAASALQWKVLEPEAASKRLSEMMRPFAEKVQRLQKVLTTEAYMEKVAKWRKLGISEAMIRDRLSAAGAEDAYWSDDEAQNDERNYLASSFEDLTDAERVIVDAFVSFDAAVLPRKQIVTHAFGTKYIKDLNDRAELARFDRKVKALCTSEKHGHYQLKNKWFLMARVERETRNRISNAAEEADPTE